MRSTQGQQHVNLKTGLKFHPVRLNLSDLFKPKLKLIFLIQNNVILEQQMLETALMYIAQCLTTNYNYEVRSSLNKYAREIKLQNLMHLEKVYSLKVKRHNP